MGSPSGDRDSEKSAALEALLNEGEVGREDLSDAPTVGGMTEDTRGPRPHGDFDARDVGETTGVGDEARHDGAAQTEGSPAR